MKRILLLVLCLALLSVPALAQESGNLNNGGFAELGDGALFLAADDGIYRVSGDGTAKIYDGKASMLQFVGGRLYFLAETWQVNEFGGVEKTAETPVSCLPDGSDLILLGQPRPCGSVYDYADDEDGVSRIDLFCGYRGFTVTETAIYFLGNADLIGQYTCSANWLDENGDVNTQRRDARYENAIVLYRMDIDGANLTALSGALGNSIACLNADGDRLYIAAGWQDTVYAYNFVNYMICDLEGNVLSRFENPEYDRPFVSDQGAFYHITNAVIPDGENMLVSLSDSEGDFSASQFCRLSNQGELTLIALEQYFVPSILDGTTLYYIGSISDSSFYDDSAAVTASLGLYRKDLNEDGLGMKLAALPFSEYMYSFQMNVQDGQLYFRGLDGEIWRISTSGGAKTRFTENGF